MKMFRALTVFPEFVESVFNYGVLRRGVEAGLISHEVSDLRDFTSDKHRSTDDSPFGGGPGMVMLAEPVYKGVDAMREQAGAIRKTLKMLHRDVEIVVEKVDKLNTHFGQARADLDGINTAAERAGKRATRLDNFDFEELAPDDVANVVPLTKRDP